MTLSSVLAASGDVRDERSLLLLVPEDAAAAVHVQSAAEAVADPLGAWAVGRMAAGWPVAAALPKALLGVQVPAVVVVVGGPAGQKGSGGLLVAVDLGGSAWEPESFVAERLLPAVNETAGGGATVRRDGLLAEIVVKGWSPSCYWIGRGGQLLLSSDQRIVSAVLEGRWPESKLVLGDEYRALAESLGQRGALWAYVSLPAFYHLAKPVTAEDPFLQRMYFLLGVENFRAMVLEAADVDGATKLRVVLRVEDAARGVLSLLGAAATGGKAIDLLPSETSGLLRIAISDLRASIGAVNRLVEQIDPEVVKEFEGERATFKRDAGFDPLDDFAANIRDELVIARVGDAGEAPAAVVMAGIQDAAKLADWMAGLAGAFKVSWRQRRVGEFTLYEPDDAQSGFAWAVGRGQLLIAHRIATIETVVAGAATTAAATLRREGFRRVTGGLPRETRLLMVAPWPDMANRVALWVGALLGVDLPALPAAAGQASRRFGLTVNLDAKRRHVVVDVVVGGPQAEPQKGRVRGPSSRAVALPP